MISFLKNHPKLKVPVFVFAFYLIVSLFAYAIVTNSDKVVVSEKEQYTSKESDQTHSAKTYMIVNNGQTKISYYTLLDTSDSIMSMLDHHRNLGTFTYKRVGYVQGIAVEDVNGLVAPKDYIWRVYDNEKDVTYSTKTLNVLGGHTYTLVLEPR